MTKRLLAPLLLSLLLVACGGAETPATPDTATAPATPTESTAPIADEPAATGEPAAEGTAATAADAATPPADAPADPAAEAAVAAAAQAAAQGPALVPGTDYVEIPGGQPFAPLNGKVEVVEVFAYSCGHCAAFDPLVGAWKKRLPSDVRFTMLPAAFSDQDKFGPAFFAAEAVGVIDRVHTPLFNAMHIERSLRPNASADEIIAVMAKNGADASQLKATIDSFAVKAQIGRTRQFMQRSGIDATPTVVVNGKYRVRGRTLEDILRITDQLVARERAATQAGGGL
ncbi:thiol:disulfide interchange protein DsbA/DsbL [Luteimonas sp. MC1750]|uniref:thiol:disulfide interchange protein DsbA/DsbL n=1 Tax=Luteimonas sp. MC1750 TaxID=2799326 RepID=UPI0018F0C645|nr:thiol:disulfide interchange protein DsbA/DsbL [Luteimonas sp. MC1750]MBJ6985637.1 thiol:disulfide interchange protein DsbA/DsbL [Luteimonas sp. MC1750]QQO06116.1 thiol:disulfide interchange protein DsbA/DsbL [Luteimonas sp. MC1750]